MLALAPDPTGRPAAGRRDVGARDYSTRAPAALKGCATPMLPAARTPALHDHLQPAADSGDPSSAGSDAFGFARQPVRLSRINVHGGTSISSPAPNSSPPSSSDM